MRVHNLFHSQSHTVFAWIKSTQVDDGIHRSFLSNGTCYSNFVPTASEFYPLRPYINHVLCNLILKFEIEMEIVCNQKWCNSIIILLTGNRCMNIDRICYEGNELKNLPIIMEANGFCSSPHLKVKVSPVPRPAKSTFLQWPR